MITPLVAGVLIGIAAGSLLLLMGQIAGVSGIFARALGISDSAASRTAAAAFIVGIPVGSFLADAMVGGIARTFPSIGSLLIGGLLVGFGTRLGSGCTSGHGVCGISRLSTRSLAATSVFVATGIATVAFMHVFGL